MEEMKKAQSQQFGLSRRNKLEVMLVNLIGWLEILSCTKRHRQRREENKLFRWISTGVILVRQKEPAHQVRASLAINRELVLLHWDRKRDSCSSAGRRVGNQGDRTVGQRPSLRVPTDAGLFQDKPPVHAGVFTILDKLKPTIEEIETELGTER